MIQQNQIEYNIQLYYSMLCYSTLYCSKVTTSGGGRGLAEHSQIFCLLHVFVACVCV